MRTAFLKERSSVPSEVRARINGAGEKRRRRESKRLHLIVELMVMVRELRRDPCFISFFLVHMRGEEILQREYLLLLFGVGSRSPNR